MLSWLLGVIPQPEIRRHLLRDEGEVIVDEVAHHWVAYWKASIYAIVGLVTVCAVPFVDLRLGWVLLVAGGLVLAWAAYLALQVHMDRFVVTNMRVFRVHGVFSESLATMPLSRILDITVHKPFVGRLFGYGHFVFESASQSQGLREITTVARPDERDLRIQRVVQRSGLRGPRVN